MTDDDQSKRQASPFAGCLAVAILLSPMAYALSVGPAVWLHEHGYLSDTIGVVYVPLQFIYDHCEPAPQALDWYVELWGG